MIHINTAGIKYCVKNRHFFWILLVFLAWTIIYINHFYPLVGQWNDEDNSHSYLVVPVFLYLLWLRRKEIESATSTSFILGLVIIVFSMIIMIFGRLGSLETLVYISMWMSLAGIFLFFLGHHVFRFIVFPFIILIFAIPLPAFVNNLASLKLKLWSSSLAANILKGLSVPVYREGNIIDLGVAQLQVVDACSGLRYLFPTIFLALLAGRFFLKSNWSRIILVLISPFLTILSNSFRVAVTGVLVRYVDPRLGEGFFHDFSGWLVYMFMLLLLGVMTIVLKYTENRYYYQTKGTGSAPETIPTQLVLSRYTPWKSVIGLLIFMSASLLQLHMVNSQTVPERKDFSSFPEHIGMWQGERFTLSREVLNSLWADDYMGGYYFNPVTDNSMHLLISYYETQTTRKTAHAPTSCLLGGGWILLRKQVAPPDIENGRAFPVKAMLMEQAGSRILANFWFEQRGRLITSEYLNKMYLLWDSIVLNRTDGALIRAEMYLHPDQTMDEGQKIMNVFLADLKDILDGYIPGRNL